ncbi:Eco57I restriction-modification methylase domain-containing protein [Bacillus anthracis]|uniref:Eco57I restriction-modification methylase domain-containing protein n=1 Tax=Bacillus anthracis TaxID=1392 RepID=UPI00226FE427|nr:Eco57I restriction-modification methylase domain-containing protein [Bacillus anthracis]MCX9099836.1 Eco57I restriction-modification methylase domain-containing protein [Bacillus anthracis]
MKAKYFDYLPKHSSELESFLQMSNNLEDVITNYRRSINQDPAIVMMGSRRLAELAIKKIAKANGIDTSLSFVNLINTLSRQNLINKKVADLFHTVRKIGNVGAHGDIVTTKEAEEALKQLDTIFRLIVKLRADESIQMYVTIEDQMLIVSYSTFERKLIYIQSANNESGKYAAWDGLEKIGDTSVPENYEADFRPNSDYLRTYAERRINQYMNTAGVPYTLWWAQLAVDNKNRFFRDHDVHEVLKRSGYKPEPLGQDEHGKPNEWFNVTVDIAKAAIQAVKEGKSSLCIETPPDEVKPIVFRPEQEAAIKKTKEVFRSKNEMLWNAKMRFGKTLSALQVVKEQGYKRVLIMTHRPVVSNGWFVDFKKIFLDNSYVYGSKDKGESISNLVDSDKPFVYFASIQDLRGSKWAGGKQGDKNLEFLEIGWDLIIIDEAHEGNETELANNVKNRLKKDHTKILELSGTPFNLMDKYDEDNIFTWDYTMEQEAKERWEIEHPGKPNPYEGLPRVSMYTFEISDLFHYLDDSKAFNFKEFFRVDEDVPEKLVHEKDVKKFLDYITTENSNTNYPYSTPEFRANLRHTLWLLPGVKEANAFEKILKSHPVFKEYNIVNVVRQGDSRYANESDLQMVREAIGENPAKTKTITLTVRKLTTGVNVPEWTGVFFLCNTESPTSYLQAAFRAQTPFNHHEMGVKKNCYIFDFAPDRALKIMSESVGLTSKKGKINTNEQKQKLDTMLNFLPILGVSGNVLKEFSVDKMLTQLKKAYAEKAVRSGFEDTSLYNDNLFNLSDVDLSKFAELKKIVGSSQASKKDFVVISENGLDEEEYDKASKAERKKKKDRTPEEEEALKKLQEMRKQSRAMISILRGVSIRIPMMIYGMSVDFDDDITINKFIELVDEKSWNEFMPNGLTKENFREFIQYYDGDVFIEAGRIIRQKAKSYDRLDFIQRTEKIAELFGTFKNPDKETVLTPWRVVNMHMVQTIGGLSFFDTTFANTTVAGKNALHLVKNELTDVAYSEKSKILDINSKTGLYPLFVATSMYYRKMLEENYSNAGKFDANVIWHDVLANNVYAVAKTPMAKTITERTLAGYNNTIKTNVEYIDGLVSIISDSKESGAKKIEEVFGNVKFDVIIGNPPYQEEVVQKESNNGQKAVRNIFQYFQDEADNIAQKYSTLIYPGRWIHRSGKGMKKFGYDQINDPRLAEVIFYADANDVFQGVSIADGLTIVLKDMAKQTNEFKYVYIADGEEDTVMLKSPGEELIPLNPKDMPILNSIDEFVAQNDLKYLSESVFPRTMFGIESNFAEDNPDKVTLYEGQDFDESKYLKLFTNDKAGKMGRATWFLAPRDVIESNKDKISEWQVVVSSANAGGKKRDNKIAIMDNNSAFGRSRVALKSFRTESEAKNFMKYAQAYLIKYAFLMTDEALTSLGMRVPDLLDYSNKNKFIDYTKPVDEQLYKLFNLTPAQINYLESKVTSLR